MRDPFPFAPPPLLTRLAQPLIDLLGLPTLALHIHEVLFAALFYHFICVIVAPWISTLLFPRAYPALKPRTRFNWNVHVVSLVQSSLINTLALYVLWADEERANMDWRGRVWGYTGGQGLVQALATGYFLWDAFICTLHLDVFGWGLLAHGWSALFVFGNGFRPFVNYYGPAFILYELSSPFLNVHWFLDKLALTGSDLQLYNGVLLMSSFFACRLCWGTYQTIRVFGDIWRALSYQRTDPGAAFLTTLANYARNPATVPAGIDPTLRYAAGKHVPPALGLMYLAANIVLNVLNVFWFGRMVETIRARFEPPFGTKRVQKEVTMGTSVDADGRRAVEVDAAEVTKRRVKRRA